MRTARLPAARFPTRLLECHRGAGSNAALSSRQALRTCLRLRTRRDPGDAASMFCGWPWAPLAAPPALGLILARDHRWCGSVSGCPLGVGERVLACGVGGDGVPRDGAVGRRLLPVIGRVETSQRAAPPAGNPAEGVRSRERLGRAVLLEEPDFTGLVGGVVRASFVAQIGPLGYSRDMSGKAAFVALAVAALLMETASAAPQQSKPNFRVLVFTKTAAFRHASIPFALKALNELGAQDGFAIDATEDAGAFTPANLERYAAVAFVLTTGDVLNDSQQAALEGYLRAGHGFVGVHSAADTEYDWPWYSRLLGTYFKNHPAIQRATVNVMDPRHLSTAGLPRQWVREDEWYNFASNPRPDVRVLATVDETTYAAGDGAMGRDHPIAWVHEFDGGRAWYTAAGHTEASYGDPLFRSHLLGGIRYAAGLAPPSILSLATTLRVRRVVVAVRYADCTRCTARLEVRLPGRRLPVPMRLREGRASATTPALPPGRWTLVVTLKNRTTGRQADVRKSVRIR